MIATRQAGSVWTPKMPGDEVFYAPLWRPDLGVSPFKSLDRNGHVCTVTEAGWGYQGYTFDGTNDKITIPNHAALVTATDKMTVIGWVKPTAIDQAGGIFTLDDVNTNHKGYNLYAYLDEKFYFDLRTTADKQCIAPTTFSAGNWYLAAGVYDGQNITAYSGTPTTAPTAGTPVATTGNFVTTSADSTIGVYASTFLEAVIGEIVVYRGRYLTLAELTAYWQTSKWRYS